MTDFEFTQLALKTYNNPSVFTVHEFEADLRRLGAINATIKKYREDSDGTKIRAILNSIVIASNCFGVSAIELISHKCDDDSLPIINSCFNFLGWSNFSHYDVDFTNKLEQL